MEEEFANRRERNPIIPIVSNFRSTTTFTGQSSSKDQNSLTRKFRRMFKSGEGVYQILDISNNSNIVKVF